MKAHFLARLFDCLTKHGSYIPRYTQWKYTEAIPLLFHTSFSKFKSLP